MDERYVGIEIGGTKLQFVAGDGCGQILERRRLKVDPARGGAGIREQIEGTVRELLPAFRPGALGVGFGGPVDWRTGRICCSHQVEGWCDFPLADWLRSTAGVPVRVDNDANTAALGEAICGAGARRDPVFYVTLGSGVGGGLVVDGRIYHGATPGEAELGHVRLDREGTIVEQRCSGWAVDQRIRQLRETDPGSGLARRALRDPGGESRHLGPALAEGDPVAVRLLGEVAADLDFALSHVVHLFHPSVVVLGGGLSLVGEPLRAAVAAALPGFLMEAFRPGPLIALAALAEDAVPVGALLLAQEVV